MAFGVIACNAIKAMIARLVGSAIAWKMSRLILSKIYLRNQPVANISATIWLRKFLCNYFFHNGLKLLVKYLSGEYRFTMMADVYAFAQLGIFYSYGTNALLVAGI